MAYLISSEHPLVSDFLPEGIFNATHQDLSQAIAIAIEGVDDPATQKVVVICTLSNAIVWDSTKEVYE